MEKQREMDFVNYSGDVHMKNINLAAEEGLSIATRRYKGSFF